MLDRRERERQGDQCQRPKCAAQPLAGIDDIAHEPKHRDRSAVGVEQEGPAALRIVGQRRREDGPTREQGDEPELARGEGEGYAMNDAVPHVSRRGENRHRERQSQSLERREKVLRREHHENGKCHQHPEGERAAARACRSRRRGFLRPFGTPPPEGGGAGHVTLFPGRRTLVLNEAALPNCSLGSAAAASAPSSRDSWPKSTTLIVWQRMRTSK